MQSKFAAGVVLFSLVSLSCTAENNGNEITEIPQGVECFGAKCDSFTALPAPPRTLAQGVTAAESRQFHARSQGAQFMPYSWFLALEQKDKRASIIEPAYLAKYNLTPDPEQEDGLPVGMVKTIDEETGGEFVGATCAFCHTADMTFQGQKLRIEGGAGNGDQIAWYLDLYGAFLETQSDPKRFARFGYRVMKQELGEVSSLSEFADFVSNLRAQGGYLATAFRTRKATEVSLALPHLEGGFGRMDAINRATNNIFGVQLGTNSNQVAATAPVGTPALWNTEDYEWQHVSGSIRSALSRDCTQATTTGAPLHFTNGRPTAEVDLDGILELEGYARKLRSPAWPADMFGAIDQTKAERGQELYASNCASCHTAEHIANGELRLVDVPLEELGTDSNAALSIRDRRIDLSALGLGTNVPLTDALEFVTESLLEAQFAERGLSAAEQDALTRGRPNVFRAPASYKAIPLDGVWSTAPYLHNNSVPTLTDLLRAPAQRPAVWNAGNQEYDPSKVGYSTRATERTFRFDTSIAGNHNTGHTYGTDLSDADKDALLEYLKTL